MPDKKIRYGGMSYIDKMEKAIETGGANAAPPVVPPAPPANEMPYKKGEYLKSGESARFWTGPRPWKKLQDKSTEGSPSFTDAELKRGYRKV